MRGAVRPDIELRPVFRIIGNQIGLDLSLFILTIEHGIHARDGAVCSELSVKAVRNAELLRQRDLRFHIRKDTLHTVGVEICVRELDLFMVQQVIDFPGKLPVIRNGGIHDEPSEKGSDACEGCDAGAGM